MFPVSGHGSQVQDPDGDEVDGYDEGKAQECYLERCLMKCAKSYFQSTTKSPV